jgi:hypothetical protein
VGLVRIHCYGCARTVSVDEGAMSRGLGNAGWALAGGQTFCQSCASARDLKPEGADAPAPANGLAGAPGASAPGANPAAALEPFPPNLIRESRTGRAWRLMRASLSVLREDPQLLVFPAVAMALSVVVGAVCFALAAPGGGGSQNTRGVIFVASLLAAYPVNFVSLYCGVALAAVLAGRLQGEPLTASDGWMAARERLGIIAAWTLVSCTVGAVLRVIEQYVPLGARIVVAIVDLSWSLATIFAVPVLAYENLGPRETFRRSSQIFRQRWGTQIGGTVGIGIAGALTYVPFVLMLLVGVATPGANGVLLTVLGGAGLFGAIAVQAALEQIFRVFVYRNAVGLDTASGPFAQNDLQAPFVARRRRLS